MGLVEVALIASVVVAAGSAAYSSYVQNDNAIDAEKAANKRADQELDAAAGDAENIREKAARLKGMQAAAIAGSGAKLNTGVADVVLGETDRLSEQDALAALKEGSQRADTIREQGQLTAGNYRSQAVASALGGVSTILGGVTSYQQATKAGRQADILNQKLDQVATRKTPAATILGGN